MKAVFLLLGLASLLLATLHGVEASAEAETEALQFVKKFIAEHPVAMFSKSYCP